MSIRERQSIFILNVSKLIQWAYEQGYELSFGDAWSRPQYHAHHPNSLHYDRLAIDLNLFRDGKYLNKTSDHKPLGEYWVSLHPDNNWGGAFNDGNHYSMKDGITDKR